MDFVTYNSQRWSSESNVTKGITETYLKKKTILLVWKHHIDLAIIPQIRPLLGFPKKKIRFGVAPGLLSDLRRMKIDKDHSDIIHHSSAWGQAADPGGYGTLLSMGWGRS